MKMSFLKIKFKWDQGSEPLLESLPGDRVDFPLASQIEPQDIVVKGAEMLGLETATE